MRSTSRSGSGGSAAAGIDGEQRHLELGGGQPVAAEVAGDARERDVAAGGDWLGVVLVVVLVG